MTKEEGGKRFVLLLRSPTEGGKDPYHQTLEDEGYLPVSVPVLKFDYINIEEYSTRLTAYQNYHAIVFTSQQAINVTLEVFKSWTGDKRIEIVKNLVCYVVGRATAKAARELGFTPHGEDAGNADSLCDIIVADIAGANKRRVLFPCSSIRKDTIPDRLKSSGIQVDEITVYETVHRDDILPEVTQLVAQYGQPFAAVFFSPSGVQAIKKNKLNEMFLENATKMIALGPTTRTEMEKEGIVVFGTAVKPDSCSLIEALNK